MPVTVAKVWRPYVRKVIAASKGDYTGLIIRDRHVTRKSEKVKAINRIFAEAAKKCAGKDLKTFQRCVGDEVHAKAGRA